MLVLLTDGRPLYRLLKSGEGQPNGGDFQPRLGVKAAAGAGVQELKRLARSHFLSREEAEAVNAQGSRIAVVALDPGVGHFARTGILAGHVDVWAGVEDFVNAADIEE